MYACIYQNGYTPLHYACSRYGGSWDIAKWLVDEHGADPKAKAGADPKAKFEVSYRYEDCVYNIMRVCELYVSWVCSVSKL